MPGFKIRQERISTGQCQDCGADRGVDGTTTQCRKCASVRSFKQAVRNARVRQERRENGLCVDCGVKLASARGTMCRIHRIKNQNRNRNYRRKILEGLGK